MPDGSEPSFTGTPTVAAPRSLDPASPPATDSAGGIKRLLKKWIGTPAASGVSLDAVHPLGGDLPPAERAMVERIVAFDKKRVDDVAIPRADIVAVELDMPLQDLLETFSEGNHSRLPVFRGDLDDPVGMVHIKDVVGMIADPEARRGAGEGPVLGKLLRKLIYVPPSMPVTDLLLRMQASRVHMALVIDEFGGTDGLVTIEDLIELIVGEIRDEHDIAEEFVIKQIGDGRWEADARAPLEEVVARIGLDVRLEEHEADTLGGLVFSLAGRVPLRGEVISHPNGHEFDICDADPRRIRRIVVRRGTLAADADMPSGNKAVPDPAPTAPTGSAPEK